MFRNLRHIADGHYQVSELTRKSKESGIKAEKHLQEIRADVDKIGFGLDVERKERQRGDEKNTRQTAKQDKKYFWLGVLCSAIIALAVEYLPEILKLLQGLFL